MTHAIWTKQERETPRAYDAFTVYRDLPVNERTIEAACLKSLGKLSAVATWRGWSVKNKWVERASAHDQHLDDERRQAQITELQKQQKKWAERRLQQAEQEWEIGQKVRERALLIIGQPLAQVTDRRTEVIDTTDANGNVIAQTINHYTTIEPAKFTMRDGFRAAQIASALIRNSLGMATESILVRTPDDAAKINAEEAIRCLRDMLTLGYDREEAITTVATTWGIERETLEHAAPLPADILTGNTEA